MTQKSCAVGIRNAKLGNHLKIGFPGVYFTEQKACVRPPLRRWPDFPFIHKHAFKFYTPNANMADHSVGSRDELHESEASETSVFCFDNASSEKSCFVDGLVCFISLCLRVLSSWMPLGVKSSTGKKEFFFSFLDRLWGEDRRSKGVHDRRANWKSLFATFQARIS